MSEVEEVDDYDLRSAKLVTLTELALAPAHRAVAVPIVSRAVVVLPVVSATVGASLVPVGHDRLVPHRPGAEVGAADAG